MLVFAWADKKQRTSFRKYETKKRGPVSVAKKLHETNGRQINKLRRQKSIRCHLSGRCSAATPWSTPLTSRCSRPPASTIIPTVCPTPVSIPGGCGSGSGSGRVGCLFFVRTARFLLPRIQTHDIGWKSPECCVVDRHRFDFWYRSESGSDFSFWCRSKSGS